MYKSLLTGAVLSLLGSTEAKVMKKACDSPDLVENFQLESYMGLWYE